MEQFKLKKQQQYCFNKIEQTQDNYLVFGKPGVGKSVLINALREDGRKTYDLAAPTGLAALNISGKTLHSLFRLPVSHGVIAADYNNFPMDDRVISNIRYNIKHLIIDEISMVRADMFDYIDRLMRFAKQQPLLPFGGAQVIVVGDFFQLPPVVVKEEKMQLKEEGYESPFIFSSRVFKNCFKTLLLDEVLRQKGDPSFIDLLDAARTGNVMPAQIKALNKQVGRPNDIRINLAGTNAQAQQINESELAKLPEPSYTFRAQVFGDWPAFPCEQELKLKVGAQVMVKKNAADRAPGNFSATFKSKVVNGTLGIVEEVIEDKDDGQHEVKIRKDNGDVVSIFTQRWERKIKEKVDGVWDEKVIAAFEQMPLALAWAVSIHKSQGQSFDKVHIDAGRIFAAGQLYVALSRARSLKGLSLQANVDARKFWADRDVMKFHDSLEAIES